MILYSIWDLPPLLLAHLLQQGTLIVTGILKTLPGWIHGLKSHPAGTAVTVPTSPSGYSPVLLTGPSMWAFLSVPGLSRLSPLISSIMFMLMTHYLNGHLFIQSKFMEYLLYARRRASWGYDGEQDRHCPLTWCNVWSRNMNKLQLADNDMGCEGNCHRQDSYERLLQGGSV